ncbi:MAG TPA: hypothetical protein VFH43_13455, partial [Candidatus Kapabacteria bacterium]|nr:hypothetical protein [Candidatus Kapabacteria bacterium]
MKKIISLALFLALSGFAIPSANSEIRLTTPASSFSVIAGVENYAAIIVEGATAGSQAVWMHSGPGMVQFDKESQRWLWSWKPSIADTAKEHVVVAVS